MFSIGVFDYIKIQYLGDTKSYGGLLGVNISAINKHLKNIFEEGELDESSTISKMEIVQRNNPMVGVTVACAVAVEEAMKTGI